MGYKSGVTIVGTVATELFSGRLVGGGSKYFGMYNQGGATLTSGVVEAGPDVGKYGTFDGTTFGNLGSAALGQAFAPDRHMPFIRGQAAVASGSTATVQWWFGW